MFSVFDDRSEARRKATLKLVVSGVIGGVVGSIAYTSYAIAFDLTIVHHLRVPGAPYLSYGQQFGVMICVAGMMGAFVGISVVVARCWSIFVAAAISAAAALAVGCFDLACWLDSNRRYGVDPSDKVVYEPILAGAALVFVWGMLLFTFALVRRLPNSSAPAQNPPNP